MKIIGIMAVGPSGVIGINNGLPWHYPSELERFRQVTDKQVIVMGRKTFSSMQEFLSVQGSSQIFVIGGAQIAHLFLEHDLISEFIMTEIHKPYKGDTYFNLALLDGWNKTILKKTKDYTIYRLTHNKDGGKN